MEKINTPIMALIEEFKRLQSKAEKLTDVIYLDGVIAVLKSRLPDEQDLFENSFRHGRDWEVARRSGLELPYILPEDYFNARFKSYEDTNNGTN